MSQLKAYYKWDSYSQRFRWWQNDWIGGQFELISEDELRLRLGTFTRLGARVFGVW